MSNSSEIKSNFDFAVQQVRNSESNGKKGPTNEEKLQFYGLYKQATVGPCNTTQPWAFQVVERAKWDAWNVLGNMSKEDAMIKYCELYMETSEKYS